jgi:DNA-binding beta-propeller fold protein YncE
VGNVPLAPGRIGRRSDVRRRLNRRCLVAVATTAVALWAAFGSAEGAPYEVYATGATDNVVAQFEATSDGGLMPFTPPRVAAGTLPVSVAVTPNGRNVYAANLSDGTVSQFSVAPDGSLSAMVPATVSSVAVPAAMAVSPDGKSLYVASQGHAPAGVPVTTLTIAIAQYDVAADGRLTAKSPPSVSIDGGGLSPALSVSRDGGHLYLAAASGLVEFALNADGTVGTRTDPPQPGAGGTTPAGMPPPLTAAQPASLALAPDGGAVYVGYTNVSGGPTCLPPAGQPDTCPAVPPPGGVAPYRVASDGSLVPLSPPTVPAGGGRIVLTPDGRHLFSPGVTFAVNADRTLSALPGRQSGHPGDAAFGGDAFAVSPTGTRLYADMDGAITVFAVADDASLWRCPTLISWGTYFAGHGRAAIAVGATPGASQPVLAAPPAICTQFPTLPPGGSGNPPGPTPNSRPAIVLGKPSIGKALAQGLPVTVTCPIACHVAVTMRATRATARRAKLRRRILGSASATLAAGHPGALHVRFTRAARGALRRLRSARIQVATVWRAQAGGTAHTVTRTVRLHR